jgi:hypothetical protein
VGRDVLFVGEPGLAPGIVEAVAFHHELPDGRSDDGDGGVGIRQAVGLAVGSCMRAG